MHARGLEQQRDTREVRRWYRQARWRRLRALVQREQPFCDDCAAEGFTMVGTEVDHTVPHRGDPHKFFDRENLRNKCKRHHSQKTRRGE